VSRNRINQAGNLLAYLAMAGLVATGIILRYRLPARSGSNVLLGLSHHEWGSIHFYIALALVVLVLIHIILHWKWITHTFGALFGGAGSALLVFLGLVLVGLIVMSWAVPVREGSGGKGRGEGNERGYRGGRSSADAPGADSAAYHR